jgi:RNA polymerase sigma factor for flagellar operon FliA
MLLESLVIRQQRTLDEALPLVRAADPAMTRESAEAILKRMPDRRPRPAATDLDHIPAMAMAAVQRTDAEALANEARRMSERASRVVKDTLATLPVEDRMLIRFRFGSSLSISTISRMLRLPQRPLYRRIESLLGKLRSVLEREGLDGAAAAQIIEPAAAEELDFGLMENDAASQTNQGTDRS